MKSVNNTDDAVSPVVGVMLMLVVTILIASLVIAFGSTSMEGVEATPTAVISMTDYTMVKHPPSMGDGYDLEEIALTHLSGDSLKLEDVRLVCHYNGIATRLVLHANTAADGGGNFCTVTQDSDGFWSPGETVVVTHTPGAMLPNSLVGTGLLGYSMLLPNQIEFQIVTVDGSVITNGYLHFG